MTTEWTEPIPVALIVARGRNGVIGRDGYLPWRLASDLAFFKATTMGKPIVMGRKTWNSLGRVLPGRPHFVLSRATPEQPTGDIVFGSDFEALLARARARAAKDGASEVMVIGGAQVYALALPHAARVYLTEVDAAPTGDAVFPALDDSCWVEVWRRSPERTGRDDHDFAIRLMERVQ